MIIQDPEAFIVDNGGYKKITDYLVCIIWPTICNGLCYLQDNKINFCESHSVGISKTVDGIPVGRSSFYSPKGMFSLKHDICGGEDFCSICNTQIFSFYVDDWRRRQKMFDEDLKKLAEKKALPVW